MTRFSFRVLAVILCVNRIIADDKNTLKKTLNDLDFDKDWEELTPLQQEMAFVRVGEKIKRLEETVIEIGSVDYVLRLSENFVDRFCKMNSKVSAAAEKVKNPPEAAIPPRLIRVRDEANTRAERESARRRIETFYFIYRQFMAILENNDESENQDIAVFKKSLSEYGIRTNEDAALAGAKLYAELTHRIHNENLERKVSWDNKEAVIAGLKFWGIGEANVISVAAALHDLRRIRGTI
ncbi:uncharacterized protein LOC135841706 [Planococcus citri]|uniref:uncharacterized protein LOC135841706 n=1 Tax=Planococcus citri TaxID=170843 RepID=UPI0031F73D16